jgi:hypothetical protein
VVAGWPGSAHDTTMFHDALERYASTFSLPPEGISVLSSPNVHVYPKLSLTLRFFVR